MSLYKKTAPNLNKLSDFIEQNAILLADNWIKQNITKSIFNERKISPKKFIQIYALDIISYFVSVIRDEQPIGNCPAMNKFINYMLKKGITSKEVFDICMGFRKVLIGFLLKNDIVLKNPSVYLDEVSSVFDANLSGVLELFTNIYAKSQKKLEIAKIQQNKLHEVLKIINFIDTEIIVVQSTRIILANKPFLEMLNVKDLKEFYSKYESGFEFLLDVNLFEKQFKNDISVWIKKVSQSNKSFESNIYHEKQKKNLTYIGKITPMPTEQINQYIITFSNISEHVKNEQNIQDMLEHDELTGFRNYPTFEHLLSRMIDESKKEDNRLFLVIADIPNLRDINDTKGRSAGDMAIVKVAEDLRFLVDNSIYLARLEGSRFGVLLDYQTEQDCYDWCVKLLKRMNQREERRTVAVTEVDMSESINKLFIRAYELIEKINNSEDTYVCNDFSDIIEYEELPEQKQFISKISKLNSLKTSVYYHELALQYESKILSVSETNLDIVFSSKQTKIAEKGDAIYFNIASIGNIKAYIASIDKEKNRVTINSFRFDKHSPLNRQMYRVSADSDIKAYISYKDRDFYVEILDMNSECIAIKIDRKRNFDINNIIYLDLLLPISEVSEPFSTNATIIRIDKISDGYKMVLFCHLDTKNKDILTKYISKVQLELIKEFKN